MPRNSKELALDIYTKIECYVSAQILICIFLGIFYALSFAIIGVPKAIIIGFFLGFLNIVPYLGLVVGSLLSLVWGVFYFSGWEALMFFGIFVVGQIIENYYLTPKLVSKRTGLHPLAVFLSIVLGGALLGVLGMVLAVPVAIVAVALLRYYKIKKSQKSV